jgi:hypothetical protein
MGSSPGGKEKKTTKPGGSIMQRAMELKKKKIWSL